MLLLTGLIFALYVGSHRAWAKSSEHQEVLGEVQVALASLTEGLQSTAFPSVSLESDGSAVSFLTLKDDNGLPHYNSFGQPVWHHWILYYVQDSQLLRHTIPWPATVTERESPLPITSVSG